MVFLWCITYPFSNMLQGAQDLVGQLELILSTPIKAQDILFGKFIAHLPTYSIILFVLAPWLVNVFIIVVPLSIFEQVLIYLVFFGIIIMAMWLGTLLSSYVESKVRKSERSRDLGRAMVFVITILTVGLSYGLIYAIVGGVSDQNSPLYYILQGFPSTWGTMIIMNILGFSAVTPANVGLYIALLIGITAFVLYLGYKAAGRFYSLEPTEMGTERVIGEGRFYRLVRRLIPSDFGVQVVTQLKHFSRKLENFSRIGYAIGISAIVIVVNLFGGFGPANEAISFTMIYSTLYPAMMMAALLGCFVIVGSKDNLWIYKKAPNGVSNFVRSVYIVHLIYTVPIGLIFSVIISVIGGFSIIETLLTMSFLILLMISLMAMAIGIAFIFPTFEERGSKIAILMMVFIGISLGIWVTAMFLGTDILTFLAPFGSTLSAVIICLPVGFIFLKIGIKKLEVLE